MTEDEAQERLEAALADWLSLSEGKPVMLTGWVLKARGQSEDTMDDPSGAVSMWAYGQQQDIFSTLGLVQSLQSDAVEWYRGMHEA